MHWTTSSAREEHLLPHELLKPEFCNHWFASNIRIGRKDLKLYTVNSISLAVKWRWSINSWDLESACYHRSQTEINSRRSKCPISSQYEPRVTSSTFQGGVVEIDTKLAFCFSFGKGSSTIRSHDYLNYQLGKNWFLLKKEYFMSVSIFVELVSLGHEMRRNLSTLSNHQLKAMRCSR